MLDRVTRARSCSLALAPLLLDAPSTPLPVVLGKRKAPVVQKNVVAVSGSPLPTSSTAAPSNLPVVHNEALDSLRVDVLRLQAVLAAQLAAAWARNSSFKYSAIAPAPAQSSLEQQLSDSLSLKGPKSKSLQTGGISVEVLSLLSANVDSVTRRGMSVAYSMKCSGGMAGSVTSG